MVGAGWLIDILDLKGKTIGGAKISLEHANFIVNTGKATAEDVITLISYIKQQVRDRFKVQDRKSVVQGKSVDLGGRRVLKKKRKKEKYS